MVFRKYPNHAEAIHALTAYLMKCMSEKDMCASFNLALSGGETAKEIFRVWTDEYAGRIDWKRIHFYWVDERCVAPDSEDSNYRHAYEQLFAPLDISSERIHRIWGEDVPEQEAERYEAEVRRRLPMRDNRPVFDCIILGIGEDMHVASIFSGGSHLLTDDRWYAVSQHPHTRMLRITMTGKAILCGAPLLIPLLGEAKKSVMDELENMGKGSGMVQNKIDDSTPASFVVSSARNQAHVFVAV